MKRGEREIDRKRKKYKEKERIDIESKICVHVCAWERGDRK